MQTPYGLPHMPNGQAASADCCASNARRISRISGEGVNPRAKDGPGASGVMKCLWSVPGTLHLKFPLNSFEVLNISVRERWPPQFILNPYAPRATHPFAQRRIISQLGERLRQRDRCPARARLSPSHRYDGQWIASHIGTHNRPCRSSWRPTHTHLVRLQAGSPMA